MNSTTFPPEIAAINWFHRIELGNGIVTPGDDDIPSKLARLHIPVDLTGMSFLDIGAWDGFFSFEAERRGASRVLATDCYVWQGKVPGKSKAGFLAARSALKSKVEDMEIDAMEICPEKVGTWDVVLLAGVIYYVKNPWLCIERAAGVTKRLLIVETETGMRFCQYPAMRLCSQTFAGRDMDFSLPNIPALRVMMNDCGFTKVTVEWSSSFLRAVGASVRRRSFSALHQGRCVVHGSMD